MAIEGPLRELALADLFQLLEMSRKTGVLTVRSGSRPHPAVVRFDQGMVAGAELPEAASRLGHLLLRAGKISEAQMEQALREQQSPKRPFGTVVIEQGWASADDVRQLLRFQVEETIYALIRWRDGYFRFESTRRQETGRVAIRLPIQRLLMEAARRIDEWETLRDIVQDIDAVPALLGGAGAERPSLRLQPEEWEVLEEIDGERSLKAIAVELGRSDFDVARVVFGLVATGVAEIRAPVVTEDTPGSRNGGAPQGALAAVERSLVEQEYAAAQRSLIELLRLYPGCAQVYVLAGRASAEAGRWREAADAFLRAVQQDPLSAAAHYHLGFAAVRTGELSCAEEAWTTYLRLADTASRRRETVRSALKKAIALRRVLDQENA